MLSVLLTIVKVIGIILLILFLLLLFLSAIVLLVPVRYRADAKKTDEITASCRLHWLLGILSFRFQYMQGEFHSEFRICGILWKRKETAAEEAVSEAAEKGTEDALTTGRDLVKEAPVEESGQVEAGTEDVEAEENGTVEADPNESEVEETEAKETGEQDSAQKTVKKKKKKRTASGLRSVWNRFLVKLQKIRYTIKDICGKILQTKEQFFEYLDIWRADETQAAFAKCRKELERLFHHIRPQKLKGRLLLGTGDPALTGEISGVLSMFYPYYGNHILIEQDFDRAVFEGELFIKGRIRAGTLCVIAARLYFDKNVRKLIKLFRKEKTDGRK